MAIKRWLTRVWFGVGILAGILAVFITPKGITLLNERARYFNEDPALWETDVRTIESRYRGAYPRGAVVFVGSSSIRKWQTLPQDMLPIQALNHGFGGSKVKDSTYYLDRLVFPFQPRAVVLYAGTNDINGIQGATKTGVEVYAAVVQFVEAVRSRNPDLPVYYISIIPSATRWKVWPEARKANELIAAYAEAQPGFTFIDATAALLGPDGRPNAEFFQPDGLHLNEKGYAAWTAVIKPALLEDLGD